MALLGLDPDAPFGLQSKAPETLCVKENPVRNFETHQNAGNSFKPSTVSYGTQPVLEGYVHSIPETSQAYKRRRHEQTSATNIPCPSNSGKFCQAPTHHPCTVNPCPIIQRKNNESLEYAKRIALEKGMTHSMAEAQKFIPVMSYPSTVVTMTNNMATIQKHRDMSGNTGPENSETKIYDLINNVLKGEKQITSVFASVTDPGAEQCSTNQSSRHTYSNGSASRMSSHSLPHERL